MHFNRISVTVKGVTYDATWHEDDGRVLVTSAYGSAEAKTSADPGAIAEKLLLKIVKARKR